MWNVFGFTKVQLGRDFFVASLMLFSFSSASSKRLVSVLRS